MYQFEIKNKKGIKFLWSATFDAEKYYSLIIFVYFE